MTEENTNFNDSEVGATKPHEVASDEGAARVLDTEVPTTSMSGIRAAVSSGEELDVMSLVGGWQGIGEATIPVILFLLVFLTLHDLWLGVGSALVASLLFGIIRLFQRQPLTQALSGVFGTLISALAAWFTSSSAGYFLPGIILNLVYGAVFVATIPIHRPLVGIIYGLVRGKPQWRDGKQLYRRCVIATAMWGISYLIRGAVCIPLYVSGLTGTLGAFRLATGVPLLAVLGYFTWLLLRGNPGEESSPAIH